MSPAPIIGVLALQGDVREHVRMLEQLGARVRLVRTPAELAEVDALVLPGGESSAIDKLSRIFEVAEPIRARIAEGMPVLGTCAGLILLADRITDAAPGQQTFGGLDVTVQRNAFGSQLDSFEAEVASPIEGEGRRRSPSFARRSSSRSASGPRHLLALRAIGSSRCGRAICLASRSTRR